MRDMKTPSSTNHRKAIPTDVKFWFYLAPFLSASVIVWTYSVAWVLREAPTAIPRLVATWQTQVQGADYSTNPGSEAPVTALSDAGVREKKGPILEVGQEELLRTAPAGNGV